MRTHAARYETHIFYWYRDERRLILSDYFSVDNIGVDTLCLQERT